MSEILTKLRPDRDLQCYFERPSAVAALSETSANGFTVSGSFRQQFDWAVLEWNRDNVFEHPALRPLPDGDFRGLHLAYDEQRTNCTLWDCTLWPTVDWPFLRIWASGADGVEREYKVPINGTPIQGGYTSAEATFELSGAVTGGDYIELSWEAGDGVSSWDRHATHCLYYDQTLEDGVSILADAINSNTAVTGMTAEASGARITLRYRLEAGANGNRIGVYANVGGAKTEAWTPSWQMMSGGMSPEARRVEFDFDALQGYVGPGFKDLVTVPTSNVRKLRWTWAASQQRGEFARTEFEVKVSNWSVSGTGTQYSFAGPGSRRVEDSADELSYSGSWEEPARGNYSGGSIRAAGGIGASVTYTYTAQREHRLYLGTRKFRSASSAGARILITVDGQSQYEDLAFSGLEDILVRIHLRDLGAGQHTVTATQSGEGVFYFDFFEIAYPTVNIPTFPQCTDTTLATDWDTDHSIALAPERTAWLIHQLGLRGRANHYVGAMWYYELKRPGHRYASATVTFSGAPQFGATTQLQIGGAVFEHLNLVADTAESIAKAFELSINAGATAVRASTEGATLTIWARAMGSAADGMSALADTSGSPDFGADVSGPLTNGADGDLTTMPWAQGWRTDLQTSPALNRAARDWHRSYCRALRSYNIEITAAFSMELQHGDSEPAAGIAQRYPDGQPAILNTPALQTNFSPASISFWRSIYKEMAGLMREAEVTPYLQFGEVQWWYFPNASGMPFYDSYTRESFESTYGESMGLIPHQSADPASFPRECEFLALLVGQFTDAVMDHVLAAYPDARFEVLYPPDVNDTRLNRVINLPRNHWTPARLTCFKTENFTYTGNRNLDKAAESLELPSELGFTPAQRSHLIGVGDYTSPWQKERRVALEKGVSSVVLFALDQFCLIGYSLPLGRSSRRASQMGTSPDE